MLNLPLLFVISALVMRTHGYTPKEFAVKAGDKMTKLTDNFFAWDYGGSIIFDGLYRSDKTFGTNFQPLLNKFLNKYTSDPQYYGYKIQHNISVPFYHAVGDIIGMFPVAYLNRAYEHKVTTGPDVDLAKTVAEEYILKFPVRLPDGTFSRRIGWKGNDHNTSTYLWIDDTYMGFTLLARLSRMLINQEYAKFIAKQRMSFNVHLQDQKDGLFFHGMNTVNNTRSCCKWGRANGWSITASVEVLLALAPFRDSLTSEWKSIMESFRKHARAMAKYQSADGRWRQLVNDDTSFLETSCTTMTLSSIARAVNEGWLDRKEFEENLNRGWKGLQKILKADGTIEGVCVGTGIMPFPDDYKKRSTNYLNTRNGGIGFVFHAAVDYHNFIKSSAASGAHGTHLFAVLGVILQAVSIIIC